MTAFVTRVKRTKVNILFLLFICLICSKNISSEELAIEIDNPKFSEKGLADKTYEIKAEKGIKLGEDLNLFNIEGKFKLDDGTWIYLKADNGNYQQSINFIKLKENIIFYTDNDENLTSDYAKFNMIEKVIQLDGNIKHKSEKIYIVANSSKVMEDFNKIHYEGNVTTTIYVDKK